MEIGTIKGETGLFCHSPMAYSFVDPVDVFDAPWPEACRRDVCAEVVVPGEASDGWGAWERGKAGD